MVTSSPTVAVVQKQPGKDIYSFKNGQRVVILPPLGGSYVRDLLAVVILSEDGNVIAQHSAGRAYSYFPRYGPSMKLYQSVLNEGIKLSDEHLIALKGHLAESSDSAVVVPMSVLSA